MSRRIGLIGRVDPERSLFDGQTVKTRMMYQLLCEMYGADCVVIVDTIDWRHRALKIAAELNNCLRECNDIVVLLSKNGRKVLYPVLARMARKHDKRIYQNLIGGSLGLEVKRYPQWVSYLNSFKVNWVESHALVNSLAASGVVNARYLPNFKYLNVPEIEKTRVYGDSWHFCIFSRVVKEKGVGDAMEAIESLNDESDHRSYQLDIYGPIDHAFNDEFEELLDKCPHSSYLGSVAPEESVSKVMCYDALLFPTRWQREGIPGTIIDALSAGTPIIGAKWPYYDEILEDDITGIGYEFNRNDMLSNAILKFVLLSDDDRNAMRHACLKRAKDYTPAMVAGEIRRVMGE